MAAKKSTVMLISDTGVKREFSFDHAERLLRMPRCGWKLDPKAPYEFTDNALYRRPVKKGTDGE